MSTETIAPPTETIFVVDDDDAVRDSLSMLLRAVGLEVETFASADDFLAAYDAGRGGCLLLDIRMPGMSGLQLQKRLAVRGTAPPIIFITGHGDVPMAVEAMRAGAVDFLQKPFDDDELLDRIQKALALDRTRRGELDRQRSIAARLDALTPRECEVMELVVGGETNKAIATRLGLSQRTVEIHRARVMDKMRATSLADLVRMVLDYDPA